MKSTKSSISVIRSGGNAWIFAIRAWASGIGLPPELRQLTLSSEPGLYCLSQQRKTLRRADNAVIIYSTTTGLAKPLSDRTNL
jgi:hypothetical protein